ncbi:IS110 family transposase [Pseudoalteromonas pernae]|uniref:IS110 family transposase n=1 Tax=Pseudoalteromonas pernae TaxID=3118054 RepID=UPI0032423DDF
MNNTTVIGVDLAKDVLQVCVYANNQVRSNVEMTPQAFTSWLATQSPSTIVFEACATSNYWKRLATSYKHQALLVSPQLVSRIRQHQKTDKNDALAIVQASLLPGINFIGGKSLKQQQLQSILRMRELAVKQKTAQQNQIKAILLEFNIRYRSSFKGLKAAIEWALEDVSNGFNSAFRSALACAWKLFNSVVELVQEYDTCLHALIDELPECKKLTRLEGVGTINAINLYMIIECEGERVFHSGRNVSACIGLTPIQHSSGGKVKLGSVGKQVKNSSLRSQLVTGAFTFINSVSKREPKTEKERWLKGLIERRGKKCAAVALANKTVRTAFAMLKHNTEYRSVAIPS